MDYDSRSMRVDSKRAPAGLELRKTYDIVRTPANSALRGVVLSHEEEWITTHYFRKATRPHTKPLCEACDHNIGTREHGYFAMLGVKSMEIVICEFTAPCFNVTEEYRRIHKTLRGAMVTLTRRGDKTNGKVRMTMSPSGKSEIEIPTSPDVPHFLEVLWDLAPGTLKRVREEGTQTQLSLEVVEQVPLVEVPDLGLHRRFKKKESVNGNGR